MIEAETTHTRGETTAPFSANLQACFMDLCASDWRGSLSEIVFLRDYERLPVEAPFDIDLLVPSDSWPALSDRMDELAARHGLVVTRRGSRESFLLLIVDPSAFSGGSERFWAYIEVCRAVRLTTELTIEGADLETECPNGFPVPSAEWRFLLVLVQALRKDRLSAWGAALRQMADAESDVVDRAAARLGCGKGIIGEILACPESEGPALARRVRERLGIAPQPVKHMAPPSLPTRLARGLERTLPPVSFGTRMYLYTLHGPDGVGKTTVARLVEDAFARLPMPFVSFHHITGWKHRNRNAGVGGEKSGASRERRPAPRGPLRRLRSRLFRAAPPPVQALWTVPSDYLLYSVNLNRKLMAHKAANEVVLCDRYIYDLAAKHAVHAEPQQWLRKLLLRTIRKPRLSILLTDAPERIRSRKQELNLREIAHYQSFMKDVLNRVEVPYAVVEVDGRPPAAVAEHVLRLILADISQEAISLLKTHAAQEKIVKRAETGETAASS